MTKFIAITLSILTTAIVGISIFSAAPLTKTSKFYLTLRQSSNNSFKLGRETLTSLQNSREQFDSQVNKVSKQVGQLIASAKKIESDMQKEPMSPDPKSEKVLGVAVKNDKTPSQSPLLMLTNTKNYLVGLIENGMKNSANWIYAKLDQQNNIAILTQKSKDQKRQPTSTGKPEVLAESITAGKPSSILFNLPAVFNRLATFNQGLELLGDLSVAGDITADNLDLGTGEITASNVIYSITAGSGVTVTGEQDLTISATAQGVTSLGGSTGALSLSAGGGIGISGLTISNDDRGSSQNIFKTIAVSGQDNVVADSNTDTLTFVAGSGISLTTSASGDSLTVTSTADPGWTDDGTTVRLSTISDSVGIGTTSPSGKLHLVSGDLLLGTGTFNNTSSNEDAYITGNLEVDGTIYGNLSGSSIDPGQIAGSVIFQGASGITGDAPNFFFNNSTDRLGIGTSSPSTTLHVVGSATISSALTAGVTTISSLDVSSGGITNAGPITGASGLTSSGTITFSGLTTGIVHSNSGGVLSSSALNLAGGSSEITGTLPITNGGTGLTSYLTGDVTYASATNTLSKLGIGSTGQVLTVSGGVPAWASITGGSGGLCSDCVVTNPGSTQSITPSAATATGLAVLQASAGSVDIFKVSSFDGLTNYFRVDSTGNVVLGTGSSTGIFTVNPTSTDPIAISPVSQGAGAFTGTMTSVDLTAARTWTFPNATGNLCLDTGNCAGSGSNLGGSGTTNYLARWNAQYVLENGSIYDNGNVGIGTTAPGSKLSIAGGVGIGTTAASSVYHTTGVAPDGGLIVEGNVGIGTTSPGYKLDVNGTLNASGATTLLSTLNVTSGTTLSSTLGVTGNSTFNGNMTLNKADPAFIFDTSTATDTDFWMGVIDDAGGDDDDIFVIGDGTSPGSNNHFTINTSGQIGIGTTNPTNRLQVQNFFAVDSSNSYIGIGTTSPGSTLDFGSAATVNLASSTTALNVESGLFNLDSSNTRVGIGNTAPGTTLDVTGTGRFSSTLTASSGLTLTTGALSLTSTSGTAALTLDTSTTAFRVNNFFDIDTSNSRIGIGTTAPGVTLDIVGQTRITNTSTNALNVAGFFNVDSSNSRLGIGTTAPGSTLDFANAATVNIANTSTGLNIESGLLNLDGSNSFVGIGTTAPAAKLDIVSSASTGTGLQLAVNSLSTGKGLYLSSTSTSFSTGSLASMYWNPGSSTTATGDLLTLDIGTSGILGNIFNVKNAGSSVFSVGQASIISALPHSFTAAGDISAAYDLIFTNQTSGNIKSLGPLSIEAGESFESNYLTLKTYNSGDLVFDLAGGATFVQGQHWDLATSSTALNFDNFFDIDTSNSRIGIGTTAPGGTIGFGSAATIDLASSTTGLNIESGLLNLDSSNTRVGIGTTAPGFGLEVNGTARVNGAFTFGDNSADTVTSTAGVWTFSNATTVDLASSTTALNIESGLLNLDSSNTRVGIGTTGPTVALDVNGQVRVATLSSTATNQLCYDSSNILTPCAASASLSGTGSANYLALWSGASSLTFGTLWDSNSRIGIGTTNPTQVLEVVGNTFINTSSTTALNVNGFFNVDSSNSRIGIGTTAPGSTLDFANAATVNLASSTTGLNIESGLLNLDTSNSRIGIGTTAPSVTLDLVGQQKITNTSTNAFNVNGFFNIDSSNSRIGIGTTGPTATLDFGSAATVNLASSATGLNIESGLLNLDSSNTRVGIGTTAPGATLDIVSSASTGTGLQLAVNSLSTGKGLYLSSTSTSFSTGSLASMYWNPGSTTTATGDLLTLDIGTSGILGNIFNVKNAGSSVFSVGQAQIISALPHSFTAAGDVNIAYDIQFTNQTASYLKSNASLYIEAGESFESNDLTLRTFNSGDLVLDLPGGATFAQAQHWDLATSATALNFDNFFDIDTSNSRIGIGTTAPTATLDFGSAATVNLASSTTGLNIESGLLNLDSSNTRVGIGTTAPGTTLDVTGTGRFSSTLTASSGLTLTTGALNLTSTSGLVALTLDSSTTAFRVNNFFDIDTSNSRIGIGTTAPGGTIGFGSAATVDLASSTTGLNIESGLLNLDSSNSRIGIGTTAPATTSKLHISGGKLIIDMDNSDQTLGLQFRGTTTTQRLTMGMDGDSARILALNYGVAPTNVNIRDAIFYASTAARVPLEVEGLTNHTATLLDIDATNISGDIANIDYASAVTQTGAITGLDIDFTNLTPSGSHALYGIRLNDPGSNTGSTEYGLYIQGTNWDRGIYSEGVVEIAATSTNALNVNGFFNIDSSNSRIGIGTTAPGSTLDFANAATINLASSTTGLNIESGLLNLDSSNTRVGIGTTAPGFGLEVNGTARVNGAFTFGDNSADTVTSTAGVWAFSNATTINLADSSQQALNIESGLLNLDTSLTRVGIGTTAPSVTLDLVGQQKITNTSTNAFNVNGFFNIDSSNSRIGIGTTAPGSTLDFASAATVNLANSSQQALNIESGLFNIDTSLSSIGIGTTAPTDVLHVVGQGLFTTGVHIGVDTDANLFSFASNGAGSTTMYIGNSSINVTASDRRLKDNIADSEIDALAILQRLEIKDFDWKEGNKWAGRGRATGLIAQEVYEILPQVVDKPSDPNNTWSVEYHHLVPYTIAAIQELAQKDIELKNQIDTLANNQAAVLGEQASTLAVPQDDRIASIEARLASLENNSVILNGSEGSPANDDPSVISSSPRDLRVEDLEEPVGDGGSDPSVIASDPSVIASDPSVILNGSEGSRSNASLDSSSSPQNDILSSEAVLAASNAVLTAADELINRKLTADNLQVNGDSKLFDVNILGNVTAGFLTITGLDLAGGSSIDTISGPLRLQSLAQNPVDIMNGRVTIDTDGNIRTTGTITADKVETNKLVILEDPSVIAIPTLQSGEAISDEIATSSATPRDDNSASIGEATMLAGKTKLIIKTTAVTDKSKIFVTAKTLLDYPLVVTGKKKGESFTVEMKRSENTDIEFDWWVVN